MAARRRAILAAGGASAQVVRLCLRRSSAGGSGKSGAKPARPRHCEWALRRRRCHWGADGSPGRRGAEPEARRPGPGRPYDPRGKGGPMTNRIRGTHAVALAVVAIAAPAAAAAPVSVNLRVEGQSRTIIDAPVTSDGHTITTPSGGTHPCDGTNMNAHPAPVPTPTAALDDGARLNSFSWDADWFPSFDDFLVKRVADESATSSQ